MLCWFFFRFYACFLFMFWLWIQRGPILRFKRVFLLHWVIFSPRIWNKCWPMKTCQCLKAFGTLCWYLPYRHCCRLTFQYWQLLPFIPMSSVLNDWSLRLLWWSWWFPHRFLPWGSFVGWVEWIWWIPWFRCSYRLLQRPLYFILCCRICKAICPWRLW